jgi:hypothetical protein
MSEAFSLTDKQRELLRLLAGPAQHIMAFGGSRSAKTFGFLRTIAFRALAAERSRHAVLRFRFNHVKASVVADTWPKMLRLCYPEVKVELDKTDYKATFPNQSEVWFGGLDDKDRTEKILGQEHSTIFLNECSQIPYASRSLAVTRLAQVAYHEVGGQKQPLRRFMFYDCNPPSKGHWTYKLFMQKRDPETGLALPNAQDFAAIQMNPRDNQANLPPEYLRTLEALPARMRVRFLQGEFADVAEGALWSLETIERWRQFEPPDMQRIVVSVDPSGSGDEDNAGNDEIGIVVAGLGTDGNGYLLEDLTLKAGPKVWGNVVTTAYDRHQADKIVAETNFGGDMVRFVVQTAKPNVPFKKLTASRGKVVRAEPISALHEQGKIRFTGNFPELEDELCSFTTNGYMGQNSPNRADAMIWAFSELFPGIVKEKREKESRSNVRPVGGQHGYLGA